MKTRILYVLVSDSSDYYAEQLYVSVLSLRKNSPGAVVHILTDQATRDSLPGRGCMGPRLLEIADGWTVVNLDPSQPKKLRSRLLKTGMRQYLEGDFLFIDCDTLIVRPLDQLDHCPAQLALCLDHHCALQQATDMKNFIIHDLSVVGVDVSKIRDYFNSGVILAKDTPGVRDFFRQWQKLYLNGYQKGVTIDQPSLAQTIQSTAFPVHELDGKWNCQFIYGARHMGDAHVFHYFGSHLGFKQPIYILNDQKVLVQIRTQAALPAEVSALLDNFFLGISAVTFLVGEPEVGFRSTRRYRDILRHFVPGKFSLLEFLLKVRARLPFAK